MTFDCYSRLGTPFGEKGPFYDPNVGHRGQDYIGVPPGTPVVAYEDMILDFAGSSVGLGTVAGARLAADGKHAGWAHLRNVRSFIGGWVPAGVEFAEVAGANDRPGTLWDGSHIHTTLAPASSSSAAAALGNLPLEDPAPRIAAALAGSASAGRPVIQEELLMKVIADTNGRDYYLGGPGGIVHIKSTGDLAAVRAVLAGSASYQQIKAAESYFKQLRTGY